MCGVVVELKEIHSVTISKSPRMQQWEMQGLIREYQEG